MLTLSPLLIIRLVFSMHGEAKLLLQHVLLSLVVQMCVAFTETTSSATAFETLSFATVLIDEVSSNLIAQIIMVASCKSIIKQNKKNPASFSICYYRSL